MGSSLRSGPRSGRFPRSRSSAAPVIAAVTVLLRACADHGSLRAGLDPSDVLLLMSFLWRTPAADQGREQTRCLLEPTVEGLRPR
jgi:hypothetical protein